jgi:hypothetical protein
LNLGGGEKCKHFYFYIFTGISNYFCIGNVRATDNFRFPNYPTKVCGAQSII